MLKVERIPLDILLLLLEHPGEIVTREEIVARVWGKDVFLDTDNGTRGAIRKIRQVLKDDSEQPRFIQTVTGQGYRFIAPIVSRPQDNAAAAPSPQSETSVAQEPQGPLPITAERGSKRRFKRRWLVLGLISGFGLSHALAFVIPKRGPPQELSPRIKSLAVLPLKNLSGDPSQEYFAEALTEELIGRLAAIQHLRVISRTSIMQFKDPKQTVPEIARKLGVDAIVEGSVMRDGDRIRIHAQLIRAANDEHLWSQTYDGQAGDVLRLESNIAQAIVEKVSVTLSGKEHRLLVARRKVSPEAYESLLKGVYSNGNTTAGLEQSVGFFQDAIKKDPTFAPAYVELANAYEGLGTVYAGVPAEETRPKALATLNKALELDPDLAPAHLLLGEVYTREWKWRESRADYQRALELEPNDADASRHLASWLVCEGRAEEGLAWLQRARELDPMNVGGLINDGFFLFQARQYDESVQVLRSALSVRPDDAVAHWFLGYTLIAKG